MSSSESSSLEISDTLEDSGEEEEYSDQYEVEAIIRHKKVGNKRMFLIKWKGYPHSDDTWEEESNLNCPLILSEYLKKYENMKAMIKAPAQAVKIPTEVIYAEKSKGAITYSVKYGDGTTGKLPSSTLRKLNPQCAIEFLESGTKFEEKDTI